MCCSSSHLQRPPQGPGTEVFAERTPRAGHGGQACSLAALRCAPWCCEGGVRRTRMGKQSVAEKRRASIAILRAPSRADWPSAMMGTQSSIQLTAIQSFSMGTHGATQPNGAAGGVSCSGAGGPLVCSPPVGSPGSGPCPPL